MHAGGGGERVRSEIVLKNAIKQEKEEPLDFSTAPSTPSKEFGQNPKNPSPGFLTTLHLCRK